jgi:uncharacterized membrane-anchored protein YhcB (DUF1043 family)
MFIKFIIGIAVGVIVVGIIIYFREYFYKKKYDSQQKEIEEIGLVNWTLKEDKPKFNTYFGKSIYDFTC